MNQAAVDMWTDALESGEFEQGKRALHASTNDTVRTEQYCCLGIACVLYQREVGDLIVDTEQSLGRVSYDYESTMLPEKVRVWLGLTQTNGGYDMNTLADDNDRGVPFTEIAKLIKSKPQGLFVED